MTVSSTTNKVSYTATASQTVFPYTFKIFADADMKVYVDAILQTLTTDYTVSGAGTSGGNVTFGTGLTAGDVVVIERSLALTQGADYVENDAFPAETHENALDRLTFITQQHQETLDRTIKFATTVIDTGGVEITGNVASRANKIVFFDANGDLDMSQGIGAYRGSDSTTTTAAYATRDLVKSTTTAQLDNVYICILASPVGTLLTNTTFWTLIIDAVSAASSAAAAAASAVDAQSSEDDAAADLVLTNADVVLTHADELLTRADTVATAADLVLTNADVVLAEAAQVASELALDTFDDRYLGAKASDPTLDNDGDALIDGAIFFDTTLNATKVYDLASTTWLRTTPSAADQGRIDTVAGISANVTTVAGISANVTTVAGISANVTTVAGISSEVVAVAGDEADIGTVATDIGNVNIVGSDLSNSFIQIEDSGSITEAVTSTTGASLIKAVADSITNVNTVAANLVNVNRYAAEYVISATAPATPSEGDLWYDSDANTLKYYTGSIWASISAGISDIVSDTTPQLGGDLDGNDQNLTAIGTIDGTNLQMDFGGLA